jgi:hypothetical protein
MIINIIFLTIFFYLSFILYIKSKYSKSTKRNKEIISTNVSWIRTLTNEASYSYSFYIICHVVAFLFIFIFLYSKVIFLNSSFLKSMFIISIGIICAVNLNVYLNIFTFRKALQLDLLKVHEVLFWQSKVSNSYEKSLAYASTIVTNKRLKKILENLAASFSIKANIPELCSNIRSISKLEELQSFTFMIEEIFTSGMTNNYHKSSITALKSLRRTRVKIDRYNAITMIVIRSIIAAVLLIITVVGPIIFQAYENFYRVFQ